MTPPITHINMITMIIAGVISSPPQLGPVHGIVVVVVSSLIDVVVIVVDVVIMLPARYAAEFILNE